MKISAVVFDFGGVMTTTTMPQRVVELAKEKGIDWNVFADGFNAHRLEYDAGRITLEELYARIWSDVGLSVPAETTAAFMKADDESFCYRNERTREWMAALKGRGFKIGILTNMAPKFAREHFEPVFADFIVLADAMVISGDEGMVKPQREIYDLLRSRINLPAEELCFIDDVEKNVNGSRAAGWNAIRFVTNDQVEADFEKFTLESN